MRGKIKQVSPTNNFLRFSSIHKLQAESKQSSKCLIQFRISFVRYIWLWLISSYVGAFAWTREKISKVTFYNNFFSQLCLLQYIVCMYFLLTRSICFCLQQKKNNNKECIKLISSSLAATTSFFYFYDFPFRVYTFTMSRSLRDISDNFVVSSDILDEINFQGPVIVKFETCPQVSL